MYMYMQIFCTGAKAATPSEMVSFRRKRELPQVGFNPTSLHSLDQCSYHKATEAAQWLWVKLGYTRQGKYPIPLDKHGTVYMYMYM